MALEWLETWFGSFAARISKWAGHPLVFLTAFASIIVWGVCGPFFGYSQGWQMVVNTGTTICTFLMVFVIQNSQNRDGLALQIKLDEIIRAVDAAQNTLIDLEDLPQKELEELRAEFATLGESARCSPEGTRKKVRTRVRKASRGAPKTAA